MLTDKIGKLKINQLSDTFKNWFSTLLFLPLAVYFRFIIGTSLILDKDYAAYNRTVWILGIIFLLWLIWKWLTADHVIITGLEKYLGVFFVIACLSTAFSGNMSFSLEKLIDISIYIFGIYILLDLRRFPILWQGIINALLITAGLSSLLILISAYPWIKLYQLTLFQILSNPTYLLNVIPRLPYSLGLHPSITAGYLVMILPLAVYQLNQTKSIFWKALQFVGIIFNVSVLLLTQSRGGLLGLLFLVIVLAVLYRERIWAFILDNKILGLFTIFTLLVAGTAFIFLIGKSRGFSLGGRTVQLRFDQWRIAYQIIRESPWFGSGLGTFGQKYLELRDPVSYPGTFFHSHNQLIHITTELGILGLLTLLVLIWQGTLLLSKERRELPASTKAGLIALGGLFGVLIPDAINSSMIILLLLFYLVWILPTEEHLPKLSKNKGLSLLSLAAILLAGGFGWILWKIQPYDQAVQAAKQENWVEASTDLHSALERDPNNSYYQHALGVAEGQIACLVEENASHAVDFYQRSFETYQNWGIDHANAAVLYAISGDYQSAVEQMAIADQYYPQNSLFKCILGDYYLQLYKTEDAITSFVKCIAERPQLLDSPFWQEDKDRRELMPTVFTRVETDLRSQTDDESKKLLAALYLAVDDIENADKTIQDYLIQNPDDLGGNVIYIKILESRDELSTAEELIERLLLSNPRNADLWIFKGKIAQQNGFDMDAEVALVLGHRLGPSSDRSWILGQYYQSQGDLRKAQDFYINALNSMPSPMLEFSHRVAGRWPVPGEYLACMPIIRTYQGYFTHALNAAQDLEDQDCTLAACIYQGLVNLNPSIREAQIRFESLPCLGDFDANICFDDHTE